MMNAKSVTEAGARWRHGGRALASLLALAGCAALAPPGTEGETAAPTFELRQAVFSIDPSEDVAVSDELLTEGRSVYGRRCASCHGARGRGDGPAAYLLYPKPRNFHRGPFRFGSSWVGEPTDEDLFRVISRGIPGSAMPSWAHLTARKRWALVHYVKSLSEYPIELADGETVERGEGRIGVPLEPANTADSIARGAELFREACIKCHGPTGQGDGKSAFTLEDDDGVPIRPRDLTTGVFKGPRTPPDLYRRIIGGIPGTPMPDHGDTYLGDNAWHLVHFVMSLSLYWAETHSHRADPVRPGAQRGEWRPAGDVAMPAVRIPSSGHACRRGQRARHAHPTGLPELEARSGRLSPLPRVVRTGCSTAQMKPWRPSPDGRTL
jgi:cytochrome c oxidase cbb3-type subunit 2